MIMNLNETIYNQVEFELKAKEVVYMIKSIYYSFTCSNEEGHEFMIGQAIYIYTYQKEKKT
jgi:hypothetical protein